MGQIWSVLVKTKSPNESHVSSNILRTSEGLLVIFRVNLQYSFYKISRFVLWSLNLWFGHRRSIINQRGLRRPLGSKEQINCKHITLRRWPKTARLRTRLLNNHKIWSMSFPIRNFWGWFDSWNMPYKYWTSSRKSQHESLRSKYEFSEQVMPGLKSGFIPWGRKQCFISKILVQVPVFGLCPNPRFVLPARSLEPLRIITLSNVF